VSIFGRRQVLLGGAGVVAATAGGAAIWKGATGSMADYRRYSESLRTAPVPRPAISELIRCATLAANNHNVQPWRFYADDEAGIRILPDLARRLSVVNPDNHHLFISLGCAAENLCIAARAKGWSCETIPDPQGGLQIRLSEAAAEAEPLFDALLRRQSMRTLYDGKLPPTRDLDALTLSGARPGVRLILMTDRMQILRLRNLTVEANSAQIADPAFVAELRTWMRFNPRAAMETGDGLFSPTTGNPILPDWVGLRMFDLLFTARTENDKLSRQIDSSARVVVFVGDAESPRSWIEVGRACQRFLLTITHLGLKCAFINQAVETPRLRTELAALVGEPGKRPTSSCDVAMVQRCLMRRAGPSPQRLPDPGSSQRYKHLMPSSVVN